MGILAPAAAQAAMRAIEIALPDRAAITRITRTVDPLTGAWTDSTTTYATGIPCRVDKSGLTARERAVAEMRGSVQIFNVLLSALPSRWPGGVISVRAGDRIVVSGDVSGTYEPAEDGGPVSDELVREVVCSKVS